MQVIIDAARESIYEMYRQEVANTDCADRVNDRVKDIFYYLSLPITFLSLFSSKIHPKGKIIVTSLLMVVGMERILSILFVNHATLLGASRVVIGSYLITKIF